MMKLKDKKSEFKERLMALYMQLYQADVSTMSVQRFESIYRQIHILTHKIKSFKGGLKNEAE